MARITEATVKLGTFDFMAGDSAKAREIPNQAFYLIGLGSGCLGTIAAVAGCTPVAGVGAIIVIYLLIKAIITG